MESFGSKWRGMLGGLLGGQRELTTEQSLFLIVSLVQLQETSFLRKQQWKHEHRSEWKKLDSWLTETAVAKISWLYPEKTEGEK